MGTLTEAPPRGGPAAPIAADDAELLAGIGRRVREARERRGMARRMLSQSSNVSERYLAHLEQGAANASVLLLRNVARALDMPLCELFAAQETSVEQRLIRRFLERLPERRTPKLAACPPRLPGVRATARRSRSMPVSGRRKHLESRAR